MLPAPAVPCDKQPSSSTHHHLLWGPDTGRIGSITSRGEKKKKNPRISPPKMQRTAIGHLLDLPTRNISPAPNWSSSNLRRAAHTYQSETACPVHEKQSKTSRTFTTPFLRYSILTAASTNHASDPITIPHFLPYHGLPPVPSRGSQKTNSKGERTAETDTQPGLAHPFAQTNPPMHSNHITSHTQTRRNGPPLNRTPSEPIVVRISYPQLSSRTGKSQRQANKQKR